jgi:uncharacterized RDD family membrane protein YckC
MIKQRTTNTGFALARYKVNDGRSLTGHLKKLIPANPQTVKDWFKNFKHDIYHEIWGERVEHPVIKRSIAFIIDYLITASLTVGLLLFLEVVKLDSEEISVLTNVMVALTYFSLLNSKFCRGQTIGKLITNIQTVDNHSRLLRVDKSLLRSIPPALLTISHPLLYHLFLVNETLFHLTSGIMLILTSSSLYFLIATKSRQTFQDLIVGTQVINKGDSVIVTTKFDSTVILVYIIGITLMLIYLYAL